MSAICYYTSNPIPTQEEHTDAVEYPSPPLLRPDQNDFPGPPAIEELVGLSRSI
jgi:hypothetical protein